MDRTVPAKIFGIVGSAINVSEPSLGPKISVSIKDAAVFPGISATGFISTV